MKDKGEVGPGVYLMDRTISRQMLCEPRQIDLHAIAGLLGDKYQDYVLALIIKFSHDSGFWCKVDLQRLRVRVRVLVDAGEIDDFDRVFVGLEKVVHEGLFVVPTKWKGFGKFLNRLYPEYIHPTPQLVRRLLEHQAELVPTGT